MAGNIFSKSQDIFNVGTFFFSSNSANEFRLIKKNNYSKYSIICTK